MLRLLPLVLALASGLSAQAIPDVQGASQVEVHYALEFRVLEPAPPWSQRPEWHLRVQGQGLPTDQGPVCLVFEHWDDWKELDALYIDVLETAPSVGAPLHPGNALVLSQPAGWDGSFEVVFRMTPLLAGSRVQQRHGRLPFWTPSYSLGESRSVFPKVYLDRGEIGGARSVKLEGPSETPAASGWAGQHGSGQVLRLDPTRGNTFLAFGRPHARAQRDLGSGALEVLQYGGREAVADPVADLCEALARHITSTLGDAPVDPSVVFVSDLGGGGMAADPGLIVGYSPDLPAGYVQSPYLRHHVAHEFYHQWLGIRIRADEAIAWFHEGFTDYLSLWHLAAAGLVTADWFAERVFELGEEAATRSTWGEIAFAQPGTAWRDGDGPRETQAYKGGAMLAFAMDVELRRQGRPGLPELIRDSLAMDAPHASLEQLESWSRNHGLGEFWENHVAGLQRVDVAALLVEAGFLRPEGGRPWAAGSGQTFFAFEAED